MWSSLKTIVCTELSNDPQQYSQKLVLSVRPRKNRSHIHPSITTLVISADLEDQMSGGDTSGVDLQAQLTTPLSCSFLPWRLEYHLQTEMVLLLHPPGTFLLCASLCISSIHGVSFAVSKL